jgi:hypothetical protein
VKIGATIDPQIRWLTCGGASFASRLCRSEAIDPKETSVSIIFSKLQTDIEPSPASVA